MKGFSWQGSTLRAHFHGGEAELLAGLVAQLVELLEGEQGESGGSAQTVGDDPFVRWESEFGDGARGDGASVGGGLLDEDPAVARMFPVASKGDEQVSAEFRRFARPGQVARKIDDATVVLEDLALTDRRGRCDFDGGNQWAWLKTLSALRLTLSARIGIVDEVSADEVSRCVEDDPRRWPFEVYEWLGYVQSELLDTLEGP